MYGCARGTHTGLMADRWDVLTSGETNASRTVLPTWTTFVIVSLYFQYPPPPFLSLYHIAVSRHSSCVTAQTHRDRGNESAVVSLPLSSFLSLPLSLLPVFFVAVLVCPFVTSVLVCLRSNTR